MADWRKLAEKRKEALRKRKRAPRGTPFQPGPANPMYVHGLHQQQPARPLWQIFREYTEAAAKLLGEVMEDTLAPVDTRIRAASIILQRGWGDAPKALQVSAITDGSRVNELTEADILAMLRGQEREQLPVIEAQAEAPPSQGDEGETPSGTG
jgi:hypothetical protein